MDLKTKREWRYVIFKVDSFNVVSIEKCGLRIESFTSFLKSVQNDEPRWIIYDLQYTAIEDGVTKMKQKLILIIYVPDNTLEKLKT